MFKIKASLSANEAVKVDALCARILGDLGSIHARVVEQDEDGRAAPMPTDLLTVRRNVRDLQDAVREQFPDAFFK
jgi:hypothetical protein